MRKKSSWHASLANEFGPGDTHGPEAHATNRLRGYGKLEILFALALLIVGITGMLLAFAVKRVPEITQAALMTPTMATEELIHRLDSQRVFVSRIKAGKEWIHDDNNSSKPIRIQPEGSLYWSCRASRNYLNPSAMLKDADPPKALPEGKYQIAIFIYRDYVAGVEQKPAAEFTMMVDTNPGGETTKDAVKDAGKISK